MFPVLASLVSPGTVAIACDAAAEYREKKSLKKSDQSYTSKLKRIF
jgi:hypothetical protein